jgi:uncharacterized protein
LVLEISVEIGPMKKLTIISLICIAFTGCNHLFYHPEERQYLTPNKVGLEYEEFYITTSDAHKLAAWKISGKEPKIGSILHFHGNAQNMSTHFLHMAWLAQFGVDVITFDYRGYGKSEGSPNREGLIKDGRAAIRHMNKLSEPRIIVAQSLGGAVAVPALTFEHQSVFSGLVIDSSFASYRGITQEKLASFWLSWPLQWPLSWLVSDAYSAVDYASKINIPTVVIHGDRDGVVPFTQGKQLYTALGSSDKSFWHVKNGAHIRAFALPTSQYRPKLLNFICAKHSAPKKCQNIVAAHLKNIAEPY